MPSARRLLGSAKATLEVGAGPPYQAPRSTGAMFALISNGVLSQPVGMAAAGFGRDIVIHAPLVCR